MDENFHLKTNLTILYHKYDICVLTSYQSGIKLICG